VVKINDLPVAPHFSLREFQCSCGCEQVKIHPLLIEKLERIRENTGVPVLVLSGYRCPRHNAEVGGVKGSYHLKGMAADVRLKGVGNEILLAEAERIGFGGIGKYPDFIHLDVRRGKARW
jgi:uncharacterized protein YcbK (DUF882 family)